MGQVLSEEGMEAVKKEMRERYSPEQRRQILEQASVKFLLPKGSLVTHKRGETG